MNISFTMMLATAGKRSRKLVDFVVPVDDAAPLVFATGNLSESELLFMIASLRDAADALSSALDEVESRTAH